ncbi:16S rRNA (cytidine(1402)-2'-O)-methyltransferase [Thermodesulfatator atlanticus]|uniref:16S rRNA (cytidine(1402)-2'-O)-methyltransferase n=1 Tax=Thermodesulfatator atlanticus TaxID=501497 RepID=UPI0003B4DAFD|nr:16S rRNA (cytidine(1402)-2'-O)-methyltransferase [Thermodesulfatator atlanticus]
MSGAPQKAEPGTLYVVATPLGNLSDITLRALDILRTVDIIASEDTRTTLKLLNAYDIKGPTLWAYHEHNEREKASKLIAKLLEGKSIALVSEAGTPGISDPGSHLVKLAHENDLPVRPIPGPSAIACALSVSGLELKAGFLFLGFLPNKKGDRQKILNEIKNETRPILCYESPHRLLATLKDALEILGPRKVFMAREMTKKFEEYFWTDIPSLLAKYKENKPRGEFTLIFEGALLEKQKSAKEIERVLKTLLEEGLSIKEASSRLAEDFGISKKEAYQFALKLKKSL